MFFRFTLHSTQTRSLCPSGSALTGHAANHLHRPVPMLAAPRRPTLSSLAGFLVNAAFSIFIVRLQQSAKQPGANVRILECASSATGK